MIGARAKLQFALCVAVAYWLVADVRLISPFHLLLAGALLLVSSISAKAVVRLLYGPRLGCTPL